MKIHFATAASSVILPLALALALLSAAAVAQQAPVTGQMMGEGGTVAAAAPAQATAASAAPQTSTAVTVPLDSSYAAAPPVTAPVASAAVGPPAAPAPPPVGRPRSPGTPVGETTRNLLQMQVDGSQARKPLPMLGVEASASYSRYMKSFNHDIPEFYKTTVGNDGNSSGNSSSYSQ